MKTFAVMAAAILLAAGSIATGGPVVADAAGVTAAFKDADKDDSRTLTLEEAQTGLGMSAERFKHLDANRDARLSLGEVLHGHRVEVAALKVKVVDYQVRVRKLLASPGLDAREKAQLERIHAGIANGSLTPAEARTLLAAERHIATLERVAKSDGTLTVAERQRLHADLNRLSGAIYKQKHDAQGTTLPQPDPEKTPGVAARQKVQSGRIHQGVVSGQLTKQETHQLIQGQKHIQDMKQDMRSDGKVTGKERAILHRTQNRQSQRIYRQKHDRQRSRPKPGARRKPATRGRRR
jgi:hypothetical protein